MTNIAAIDERAQRIAVVAMGGRNTSADAHKRWALAEIKRRAARKPHFRLREKPLIRRITPDDVGYGSKPARVWPWLVVVYVDNDGHELSMAFRSHAKAWAWLNEYWWPSLEGGVDL